VKALARSPGDRYQTAAELRAALRRVLESEGVEASQSVEASLKDVGVLLGGAFAERRAKANETIEAELKRAETMQLSGEGFGLPAHLPSLAAATASESGRGAEAVARPPVRPRWPVLAMAAALAAVGLGGALFSVHPLGRISNSPAASLEGAHNDRGAPRAPERVVDAPPINGTHGGKETNAKILPPAETSVHVHLSATPASAVLYLDGKRLDGNPFEDDYPRDTATHTVRAEAPGYATSAAGIVLDGDVKLVLPLSAAKIAAIPHVAAASVPSRGAAPAPAPAPVLPASATSANPDCSPPFYFDAQGIKRLKPECI
jgi:hypothetical protein